MIDPHADDEIHAGYNSYQRNEMDADLIWLASEREIFLKTVAAAATRLAQGALERRPEWLQCWSFATRRDTESPEEVAQGFIEQVAACARDLDSDLFDHDAIERAEEICRGRE